MLYAIQFASGLLLGASQNFDGDDAEFHTYTLSEAGVDDVPYLADNTVTLNHWLTDAREGRTSYDAYTEESFRRRLAQATIVEVEVVVLGEAR